MASESIGWEPQPRAWLIPIGLGTLPLVMAFVFDTFSGWAGERTHYLPWVIGCDATASLVVVAFLQRYRLRKLARKARVRITISVANLDRRYVTITELGQRKTPFALIAARDMPTRLDSERLRE